MDCKESKSCDTAISHCSLKLKSACELFEGPHLQMDSWSSQNEGARTTYCHNLTRRVQSKKIYLRFILSSQSHRPPFHHHSIQVFTTRNLTNPLGSFTLSSGQPSILALDVCAIKVTAAIGSLIGVKNLRRVILSAGDDRQKDKNANARNMYRRSSSNTRCCHACRT